MKTKASPANTMAIVAAIFCGAVVAAFGLGLPSFLIIGLLGALYLLLLPSDRIFLTAIAFSFVMAGVAKYFAGTNAVANIGPALLALLAGKIIFETGHGTTKKFGESQAHVSYATLSFIIFLLVVLTSAFNHSATGVALILGLKTHTPILAVLLLAGTSVAFQQAVTKFWNMLLAIAVIQLPFIIYQYLFVASTRTAPSSGPSWDSLVGTMGGNPDGGGSSGALAIFLSLCLIYLLNLVRFGKMRKIYAIPMMLSILLGIGLAEVKIVFLLIPIGMLAVFWSEVRRKPVAALLLLLGGMVGIATVLYIYQTLFWSGSKLLGNDLSYNLERSITYILDPNYFHVTTGEVGRFAGILLWWKDAWGDPYSVLLGNGPGASRQNSLFLGDIARRYLPFSVDSTALVSLLWDFGILGTAAYFSTFALALVSGANKIRHQLPVNIEIALHTSLVGIIFLLVSTIYNKDVLYLPAISLLAALCLGTVIGTRCQQKIEDRRSA